MAAQEAAAPAQGLHGPHRETAPLLCLLRAAASAVGSGAASSGSSLDTGHLCGPAPPAPAHTAQTGLAPPSRPPPAHVRRRLRGRELRRAFTVAAFAADCLGCFLGLRGRPRTAPLAFSPRHRHFAGGGGALRAFPETLLGQAHNYGTAGLYAGNTGFMEPLHSHKTPSQPRRTQSGSAVGWRCQFPTLLRAPVTV